MSYKEYKTQVYETALKLVEVGLIRISAGNISMALPDGKVAITPSSIPYDEMVPEDVVIVDVDGTIVEGSRKPSVEMMLHLETMRSREDIHAVIHTHSINSMVLSLINEEIPIINSELVSLGGPIPLVDYILPGTDELAKSIADTFSSRSLLKAVLLENHGAVVVGATLKAAFQSAYNLETGAEVYLKALSTGKQIRSLTAGEYDEVYNRYYKKKGI